MFEEVNRPLDISKILEGTKDCLIGKKIFHHSLIGSTNDMAYDFGERGEEHGVLIIAEEQSAGRGRLKRKWESARFKGVYLSILLRPERKASILPRFAIFSSACTAKAIMEETGVKVSIKWPNDILIKKKKVAGILSELKIVEDIVKFLVIGIGINVNHLKADFSEEIASRSTSLLMERGQAVSRESLIIRLLRQMNDHYSKIFKGSFSILLEEWKRLSPFHENCPVIISDGDNRYQAVTRGMTEDGELLIENERGQKKKLSFGELTTLAEIKNAAGH